jgi:predicted TPR repeat methyltransferase
MNDDALGNAGEGLAAKFAADPAEVAAMYDDWVPERYDADLEAWGYDAPARVVDIVAALVPDSDLPILDAGCGSGLVGIEFARRGIDHVVGGDFSPKSVEIARDRGIYDEVVELDLNEPLAFDDDAFRAAVSVGVFSYLRDPEATIRELLRVVEPGGPLVFTQRTDLWDEFAFPGILRHLVDDVATDVTVSEHEPYLPGHPEFGDDIGIHYVTLIASC